MGAPKKANRRFWPGLALAMLLPAATAPAWAGPPASPQATSSADSGEMRETLQLMMIASMKKALELTRDQETVVVPKVEQVLEERQRYALKRREALQSLQARLAGESVSEKEYRDGVMRLDDLERVHHDLELQLRAEIDRSLSARQRAQLRVFVPGFRKQIQMRIDAARRARPVPQEITPPVPPPDEDEQDDEEF